MPEVPWGHAFVGTSGFAYPGWAPRFYAAGTRGEGLLGAYAARLLAVELNSTFYRRPSAAAVASWLAATPEGFRFCLKAQRGTAFRAFRDSDSAREVGEAVAWLTNAYRPFGERLGGVLLVSDERATRSDEALARLLEAWPATLPLALELRHPSWWDDEVHALLRAHGAVLVATDRDDDVEPDLRVTGAFLYLRLRRTAYAVADLRRWAERLQPFIDDGLDAFVFLRHDAHGDMAIAAERLVAMLGEAPRASPGPVTARPTGRRSAAPGSARRA